MTRNSTSGFTLVELMVAIAIVGIISVVILNIFDTTSQNYYEVNQLADLNERVRYGTETVRNYLQGAGNQGSPDSLDDPRVHPKQPGVRVTGIVPYDGWQDDRSPLPADIAANNPEVAFDGIVVVGAYDFPLAFEFAGLQGPPPRFGRIYGDKRGFFKLTTQDLFDTSIEPPDLTAGLLTGLGTQWPTRALRIADRQGFYQFIGVTTITLEADPEEARHPYVNIGVLPDSDALRPRFKGNGANDTGDFGLDIGDDDIAYDAGLLDAFWFHVEPSVSDPTIMTLVRERLCAADVIKDAFAGGSWDPETALSTTCGGVNEKVVIATNVADFQVWFDCADTADGALRGATWDQNWIPNDHGADCLAPGSEEPGEIRAGHVRLALHTSTERQDLAHIQFEDADGAVCDTTTFACDPARMAVATLRTFDFFPNTEGAARVVVLQSDFEMVNFVNRNVYTP